MQNYKLQNIVDNHHGLNMKLKNPSCNKSTILSKTLADNGIKNLGDFISPVPGENYVPSDALRHPLGLYLAKWFDRKFKPGQTFTHRPKFIYILVDNDADGFTSAGFMYKYLKATYGVDAKFIFTHGKNHGIKAYSVKNRLAMLKNIGMLIIPDAGLSLDDINFLRKQKFDYLVIDHHDVRYQKYDRKHRLHIFNNQWGDSKLNKEFTGVGMVYQFCALLDYVRFQNHEDPYTYADKFLYLLSIGQVGDVSDIADPEIRYYVLRGFKQMAKNPLLMLTTAVDRASAHELSFSIIPKINAVCRTGSLQDKRDLLNAMVDAVPSEKVKISYRRKSKIDHKFHKHYKDVDHYYLEAKSLNRIKSRQKRAVKRSLKSLKNVYETKSFIVGLDKTGNFKQEEAGLIATQLSHRYQKPTIVLRVCGKPGYYKGSARGNTKVMKDFKRFCNQTQKFVYALGHSNAFGVMIGDEYLDQLLKEYKNVDLNDKDISYDVDKLYLDDVPKKNEIVDFDANRSLFGGHVKEPLLGFAGLEVKPYNVRFYGSVLTMKAHGLKFIMFNTPKEIADRIYGNRSGDLHVDLVGIPDINRFMKFHYPQVIINNLKIVKPLKDRVPFKDVSEPTDFGNFYF